MKVFALLFLLTVSQAIAVGVYSQNARISLNLNRSTVADVLNEIEKDIIRKHMWPLTVTRIPRCREAGIVCLVDKFCSLAETVGFRYKRQFVFEHN